MTVGVVDSTVIIHVFRKNPAARAWLYVQPVRLLVTPITWMEVMYGAPGKAGQATCKAILSQFDMEYLMPADMDWAMQQLERYRLKLRKTLQTYSSTNDVRVLIEIVRELYQHQGAFASNGADDKKPVSRIKREDLQLICYEYIYA